MNPTYEWYAKLLKPAWAPPSFLFGPVWTVLYIAIAVTFGSVIRMAFQRQISWMVALPFVLNIFFNLLFTPLQFGLRNNTLALIDITLVWITLVWAMVAIYTEQPIITYSQIPYLAWVTFATVLQINITYLNR